MIVLSGQEWITYNAEQGTLVCDTGYFFMPSSIEVFSTEMPGVLEIRAQVFEDDRGFFTETYSKATWGLQGFTEDFVQDNLSFSNKGVMRGLHYQILPHGMGKLIRVLTGAAFDVIVDLRRGSPTHGRWMGRMLQEDTPMWLWVPVGFAHGFLALSDNTRVYYKCTGSHDAGAERSLRYSDPALGIEWPAPVEIISQKDANAPLFKDCEYNFNYEG